MEKYFKNYEIVLVSANSKDAQWILKALKRSDLNNELIWLKDVDRAMDYIQGDGLYQGQEVGAYKKVFILDCGFPDIAEVYDKIKASTHLANCEIHTLSESKEQLRKEGRLASRRFSEIFAKLHTFGIF